MWQEGVDGVAHAVVVAVVAQAFEKWCRRQAIAIL